MRRRVAHSQLVGEVGPAAILAAIPGANLAADPAAGEGRRPVAEGVAGQLLLQRKQQCYINRVLWKDDP